MPAMLHFHDSSASWMMSLLIPSKGRNIDYSLKNYLTLAICSRMDRLRRLTATELL